MRTLPFLSPALAVAALLLTSSASHSQGVSLSAGAGYYTLTGDFQADAGLGIDAALRIGLKPNFQLGVAVQRNSHYWEFIDANIAVLGVMVEPRYRIPLKGSSLRPFVAGRVGWVRESASIEADDGDVDASANGFTVGAMGGLEIPLSPAMALETAVVLHHVGMGEIKIEDEFLDDSGQSGMSLGLRVALSFALGGR